MNMKKELLAKIEKNSRIDLKELAVILGVAEIDVVNTLQELQDSGVICGYHTLINWDHTSEEKVTALIDYNNNVVHDSVMLAKHLGETLRAVRVDTSKSLIDHYFDDKDTSGFDPHGVCKELIFALRKALDDNGFNFVKIIVSSSSYLCWEVLLPLAAVDAG